MSSKATTLYLVVFNHEEQYSVWPASRALPTGWTAEGFSGSQDECAGRIETLWTDLRPRSARQQIAELEQSPPAVPPDAFETVAPSIVEQLCTRELQQVTLRSLSGVSRGVAHVTFALTGTELAMRVLPETAHEEATLTLVGELTLDFVPLRFQGRFDPLTLTGSGMLERHD